MKTSGQLDIAAEEPGAVAEEIKIRSLAKMYTFFAMLSHSEYDERRISIKAIPMSLVLEDNNSKSYKCNILDTLGHVNFSDEMTAALKLADGTVLIVDAAEGVILACYITLAVISTRVLETFVAVKAHHNVAHDSNRLGCVDVVPWESIVGALGLSLVPAPAAASTLTKASSSVFIMYFAGKIFKGVLRFGKKGKLAPRFVGPFESIKKVGPMANRLDLPEELNGVHDTFHVLNLKKCLADLIPQVPLDEIRVEAKSNFVEEPVESLEREFKKLKRSRIAIVKVRWNSRRDPEFTWEREDQMKLKYPHLFSNSFDDLTLSVYSDLYRVDGGAFVENY
ncbi:putative reverse transcriptase domain-containing protein, partial [Tanacetum coccineum]